MDLLWHARYRRGGGTSGFLAWEFSASMDSYETAPAPAQVGKRVVESLFQRELEPSTAGLMNNVVHWATGIGWGTVHGVIAGWSRTPRLSHGLVTGTAAFVSAYAMLAPAKLYKPMWKYSARTLAKDLSAHLAFGLGTSAAFKFLTRHAT